MFAQQSSFFHCSRSAALFSVVLILIKLLYHIVHLFVLLLQVVQRQVVVPLQVRIPHQVEIYHVHL